MIPWFRNIPVFSFLIQKGRCHKCHKKISWRYPVVEILTACLFTYAAYLQPNYLLWPFAFYFLGAIIASAFIDFSHWIIPDKITLPGIAIGFIGSFFLPSPFYFYSLLGILFGGGLLYAIAWGYYTFTGKDGLGGGDIKFLAMVGAFLGVQGTLITIVLSSLIGSIFGIFMIFFKGKKGNTALPFGPFLSFGALIAFLFGSELWQWYFKMQ